MNTIHYATGRDYGTAQVLTITIDRAPADPLDEITVRFTDSARNIAGTVRLLAIACMYAGRLDPSETGAAVLREYDAGRYTLA
jgi:hypothetical protein